MSHLRKLEGSIGVVPNRTRGNRQGSSSPLTAATLHVAAGFLRRSRRRRLSAA
jgi:hypothetical protein